ncbi:MAG: hypothetical protein JWN22_3673 [Nocardioides sp.]|nr:hypothetical protein [Nocardioides sp.]
MDAPEPPRRPRRSWGGWRIGTPLVVLLSGGLFVVSAHSSEGTDLRPGRYTDLASLVSNEADDYDALKQRVTDLNADVATLTKSVDDREVKRYRRKIERLNDPAGLVPRTGPGITVTLSDAPEDVINATTVDPKYLVVHQQDIQAVVNAMWKAGASAVTIQGQRVVSTTGIKCEGNAVQLQGYPYSQPYVISAVGSTSALVGAVDTDDYLRVYRAQAADPEIAVGWDLQVDDSITAPAFDGLLDLNYAEPLR